MHLSQCRWLAAIIVMYTTTSLAREQSAPPPQLRAVADCAAIQLDADRLRCFDHTIQAFLAAQQRKEILVTDGATVRESQRRLFGLGLAPLGVFEGSAEVDFIEVKLASVGDDRDGRWTLTLDDGAVWSQVDYVYVNRPVPGKLVKIRRASLGGFIAEVGGGKSFRVKRVNR